MGGVVAAVLVIGVARAEALPLPDECLQAMELPAERRVLLSVLSPRMVYSMTEWPRMQATAEAEGFEVIAWRSPLVPEAEWRSAVRQAGWARDASRPVPAACMAWLGRPNHFPYSRVIGTEGMHPWPIWGVLPEAAWVESLRCRRDALAAAGLGCAP